MSVFDTPYRSALNDYPQGVGSAGGTSGPHFMSCPRCSVNGTVVYHQIGACTDFDAALPRVTITEMRFTARPTTLAEADAWAAEHNDRSEGWRAQIPERKDT